MCGQAGHWNGDDVCPMSRQAAKAKVQPKAKTNGKSTGNSSKVMIVRAEGTQEADLENAPEESAEKPSFGNYFTTFVCEAVSQSPAQISDVLVPRPGDFAGFAVLDTACQKNVCRSSWLAKHTLKLKQHKLTTKNVKEREGFQFGVGAVQFSKERAFLPVALDGSESSCCLFGTSVLRENCEIPLLLSLPMIERKLQAVIDFPKGCVYLSVFGIEVPIVKINGHICVAICNFPESREPWQLLSSCLDQGDPDLELVRQPTFRSATGVNGNEPSSAASMARCDQAPLGPSSP